MSPTLEKITRLNLVGNFMKPITIIESQKNFERFPHMTFKQFYAFKITHPQSLPRTRKLVGHPQQRSFMKVCDQANLKKLVAKLAMQGMAFEARFGDHCKR